MSEDYVLYSEFESLGESVEFIEERLTGNDSNIDVIKDALRLIKDMLASKHNVQQLDDLIEGINV